MAMPPVKSGLPETTDPEYAPRECTTGPPGRRQFKWRFDEQTARTRARSHPRRKGAYECAHCGWWHVGSTGRR